MHNPVFATLACAAILSAGCSTVEKTSTASTQAGDKKESSVKCSGWGCATADRAVIVIAPRDYGYGYDAGAGRGYYPDYRGRHYRGSYPIGEGQACSGPFGQTWHGICYPERPPWPLN